MVQSKPKASSVYSERSVCQMALSLVQEVDAAAWIQQG